MFLNYPGKNNPKHRGRRAAPFERRLLRSVLLAGAPGVALGLLLLWTNPYSLDHKIEGTTAVTVAWLALSFSCRGEATNSVRALSNVVSAMGDEDFSFRATHAIPGDALGELALEINNLARALDEERLASVERSGLLRKVMTEAGPAILAFAPNGEIRLLNRAAVRLLGSPEEDLLGKTAKELGIADLLEGLASETITRSFGDQESLWIVRRTYFRQHGVPHRLIVLSEALEALREQERSAWQSLIRVLSHEINNSLAPIKSTAGTSARSLARTSANAPLPDNVRKDLKDGLERISNRAEILNRFLQSYTQLAKLPPPARRMVNLRKLLERATRVEDRVTVTLVPGPEINVDVDPDQIEQALINLIKNAAEAVLQRTDGRPLEDAVKVGWETTRENVVLLIRDSGVGLSNTENLFVPFYTTKKTGSGVGLLLSRQIIEAHTGRLALHNRKDGPGCEVEIRLPFPPNAEFPDDAFSPREAAKTR